MTNDQAIPPAADAQCPLGDPTLCRPVDSAELSGGRVIVQTTCQVCGGGCSRSFPIGTPLVLRTAGDYEPQSPASDVPLLPAEASTDEPAAADLKKARKRKS